MNGTRSIRLCAQAAVLLLNLFLLSQPALSQETSSPASGSLTGIHLSAGLGGGPSPTGILGARLLRGRSTQHRFFLEYSRWASGVVAVCDHSWLESYLCSVDGHNLLGGLLIETRKEGWIRPYADLGAGLVLRDGKRLAPGFGVGAGLRLRAESSVSWKVSLRWLEVLDNQYRDLMGESLRFLFLEIGLDLFGQA